MVLQYFPEQKFIIIGKKGDAYKRLKKMIFNLGIEKNIKFIGRINASQVPHYLQSSRAYVQISDTETFGLGVAEAMSCGTPVIVSKRGAIPEVVGDCGIYVNHNNSESVASGIISLLRKNEAECREIGLRARKRIVNKFSYEQRKKSIKQTIENI